MIMKFVINYICSLLMAIKDKIKRNQNWSALKNKGWIFHFKFANKIINFGFLETEITADKILESFKNTN